MDLWNAQTGEKEKELINDQHKIEKIVFSPTGKYLACSSNKVTATIWEVSTGKKVQTIYGYSEHINSMTFNPQESLLMTAARDGSVKIWEYPSLQNLINRTNFLFQNRVLTQEEKDKFHLE